MARTTVSAPKRNQSEGGAQPALGAVLRALFVRQEAVIFALLLLTAVGLGLRTETFLTGSNLLNIARGASWFAIAAFGACMVILIGGIDLSVGAVMALAGLLSALCAAAGVPPPLAVLAGLGGGGLVGFVNGWLVGVVRLPPFIVTLGTMGLARGLTLSLTGGAPLRDLPAGFRWIGQADLAVGPVLLPMPLIWMLLIALLAHCLLQWTVLGRYIYTLGGSEEALATAGVSPARVKVTVYTLSSVLAAFAGVLMTARLGVAAPTAAQGYELDIIAMAVIGGASLFGGEGSILGVALGAGLMQVVRNGLVQLGLPAFWQVGAIGAMILTVVLIDAWRRRRIQR